MAKRRRASRPASPPSAVTRRARRAEVPQPHRIPTLRLVLLGLAALGAVGFVGLALLNSASNSASARSYTCDELLSAPADASNDGFSTKSLGSQHVAVGTKIRYGFCPPTSGAHYNAAGAGPLRAGFYGPDTAAGPGGWVHNLEHGYVAALYRCSNGVCPAESELQALRSFAANGPPTQSAAACGYRSKVIVARMDDMAAPYALVAWDRALLLDSFDAGTANGFASRFIEATGPEPNAC